MGALEVCDDLGEVATAPIAYSTVVEPSSKSWLPFGMTFVTSADVASCTASCPSIVFVVSVSNMMFSFCPMTPSVLREFNGQMSARTLRTDESDCVDKFWPRDWPVNNSG